MSSRLIMYSMLNKKIEGLVAAPFTPFDEQGELNLEIIPSYYSSLKKNNVAGAFICGSTGEGVSLTFEEKVKVMTTWSSLTKHDEDFVLMMFLGGTNVKECQEDRKSVVEGKSGEGGGGRGVNTDVDDG